MVTTKQVIGFFLLVGLAVLSMSFVLERAEKHRGSLCWGADFCISYFTFSDMLGYASYKQEQEARIAQEQERKERQRLEDSLKAGIQSLSDSIQVAITLADSDSTRFWLPSNNRSFWDQFFTKLENLKKNRRTYRILHYGDSQIEMDRITAQIRKNLQQQFGGGGPGLLPPLQLVPSYTMRQVSSENWNRRVSYGTQNNRAKHNRYGVSGMLFTFDSTYADVSFTPRYKGDKYGPLNQIRVVKLLLGSSDSSVKIGIHHNKGVDFQRLGPTQKETMVRWRFGSTQKSIQLSFEGDSTLEVLGVALDPAWGVAVDNIAWRGSSGLTFTSISRRSLEQNYRFLDVNMVIMQYGGNSVPYIKNPEAAVKYAQRFGKQIEYVQSIKPGIQVLVIGPADMSANEKGEMVTYPMLEEVIEQMRLVSNQKGAAFWSMYHAMGGKQSMRRWVHAEPALGAPDYIHFTTLGAEVMGDLLVQSIERERQIYLLKKRLKEENLEP